MRTEMLIVVFLSTLVMPVYAEKAIPDGTYVSTPGSFPLGGGCGVLTIAGGKPTSYAFGLCKDGKLTQRTYRGRKLDRRGDDILIDRAIYSVQSAEGGKLIGVWQHGDHNTRGLTFVKSK